MNFKKWVINKYLLENSPEGDLARDMQSDEKLTRLNDDKSIFAYLDNEITYYEAVMVYEKLKKLYVTMED